MKKLVSSFLTIVLLITLMIQNVYAAEIPENAIMPRGNVYETYYTTTGSLGRTTVDLSTFTIHGTGTGRDSFMAVCVVGTLNGVWEYKVTATINYSGGASSVTDEDMGSVRASAVAYATGLNATSGVAEVKYKSSTYGEFARSFPEAF